MCCRELGLLGLAQKLVGFLEVARGDLRLRAGDEIARDRVLRIERRYPLHRLFVLRGDLAELLGQPLDRDILLPKHTQQGPGRALGDTETLLSAPNCWRASAASAFALPVTSMISLAELLRRKASVVS